MAERINQGVLLLCAAVAWYGCGSGIEPRMVEGGLYSVEDGQGAFRPAKLIAFDSGTVHLRLYCNRYEERPDTIHAESLRLSPSPGELNAREHFPIRRWLFRAWVPELQGFDSVTESERAMMGRWERANGAVVGG